MDTGTPKSRRLRRSRGLIPPTLGSVIVSISADRLSDPAVRVFVTALDAQDWAAFRDVAALSLARGPQGLGLLADRGDSLAHPVRPGTVTEAARSGVR
ncbi:hypothetical protein ADL21_03065 [Streptomyces albus subsp. albus]|nr:hypothetical protein ADL21_03065 [Streptomyces albus subsp. albus]